MKIFDFFTTCLLWHLFWMLLSFLLAWWLAKNYFSKPNCECDEEIKKWNAKYHDLELKYNQILTSNVVSKPLKTVTGKSKKSPKSISIFDGLDSKNLQIIEGIGPKMEELLVKNSIQSWKKLAGKTPEELRAILDKESKSKYKIIDPSTWSDQAQLAVNGKFPELIAMQKTLNTGKTDAISETDSKLEKVMIKMGLIKKFKKDDLKAIEGIGPKIEKLFLSAGINTWDDLSDSSVEQLKKILSDAGDRYRLADPGTWPNQAELASEGRWRELKELQKFLKGGK